MSAKFSGQHLEWMVHPSRPQYSLKKWALGVYKEGGVYKVWAFRPDARDYHGRELTFQPVHPPPFPSPSPSFFKWHFQQCLSASIRATGEEIDEEEDSESYQEPIKIAGVLIRIDWMSNHCVFIQYNTIQNNRIETRTCSLHI